MEKEKDPSEGGPEAIGHVVDRNIRELMERRQHEQQARRLSERLADRVTRFAGSMRFVYLHLIVFGLWIMINLGWVTLLKPFDPTFVVLAMAASVEAIFLSTFVLITQNRMAEQSEKRAELDLQISLLTEHELTRLFNLVTQIAEKMGVDPGKDPDLPQLLHDIHPGKVLDKIDSAVDTIQK